MKMSVGFCFEDLKVGQEDSFLEQVLDFDLDAFRNLSGDYGPVHTDADYCAKTIYGKPIGYAFYLTALLSRFYGEYLPGGCTVCLRQEADFVKPYYAGDFLTIWGKIISKSEAAQTLEIETRITRNTELILRGKATVAKTREVIG